MAFDFQRHWHAVETAEVLAAFDSRPEGLSEEEAEARRAVYGQNRLPGAARRSALVRLLLHFHNLLIYTLLVAAVLAVLIRHNVDAIVILAVVLVNVVVGFIQEGRAKRALEAIRSMIDPRASVMREGRRVTVAADQVVPGDIVLIGAGDRVPADLRLIRARNLRVEEAVLTGESVAVEKALAPVADDAALGDRTSMTFSGTFVAAGQGMGVAIGTGVRTELGRISQLIGAVESLKTPLTRQMDKFAKQLMFVILGISTTIFGFATFMRGYDWAEAFMVLVSIAVAAIPEGLPAIMTITLAIGVQRMAARNAIIRRLPAVETLGSISIICSDKTGTLTRNEMTVRRIVTGRAAFEVTGAGYKPVGEFRSKDRDIDPKGEPVLTEIARAGLLCNDAELRQTGDDWVMGGDPMEGALISLAMKAGHDVKAVRQQIPRTDEIPFDAKHRFMATLHHSHEKTSFAVIKGAPEWVLAMCDKQRTTASDEAPIEPAFWRDRTEALASDGHRVLAIAVKPMPHGKLDLMFTDVENGATLLGLVGLIDPPREEVIAAIAQCRAAGIRVKMITGDHAVTAGAIARQLGLAEEPKVIEGHALDALDASAFRTAAREVAVFARTSPEHKLRLVEALQADGEVVAMTGDGVNDAPALKRADVGVAMGGKGTEAAKEAAEMVLADDNFASIVAAIREGRTVYDNLTKSILFLLPINGGESLSLVVAILFGLVLPIEPLQILWVNMVSSVALAAILAFEPTEPDVMRRHPRSPRKPLLSGFVLWRIVLVSALFLIGIFGVFEFALARGGSVELARTAAVNTLVVMEIFYLFSVRYLRTPSFTFLGIKGTPRVLAAVFLVFGLQLLFTYAPFMQSLFTTAPVPFDLGIVVVAVGVLVLGVLEIEKLLRWRFFTETAKAGGGTQ